MIQYTPGQTFYYQLSDAIDAQDFATLETLYHPDAVSLSMSTGQVFRGRKAILDSFKRAFQIGGAISSRAVESLVEAGGAVCVEAQLSTRIAQMQTYDIYLLQAGMVKQHVGGLISPRPPSGRKSVQGWSGERRGVISAVLASSGSPGFFHAGKPLSSRCNLGGLYNTSVLKRENRQNRFD